MKAGKRVGRYLLKRHGKQIAVTLGVLLSVASSALVLSAAQKQDSLTQRQIEGLLRGGVYSSRIAALVQQRGIDFTPSRAVLSALREDGAQAVLIRALLAAKGSPKRFHSPAGPDPSDPESAGKAAAALYSKGDLKAALKEYCALERLHPKDPSVHYETGRVLYANSNLREAVLEFREAVRLKPDFIEAHAALGDALLKQGNRRGALEEYRRSMRSGDPTLGATLDWLSKIIKH
jgi:tetratricopeptide (TPR) repeat protein